MPAGPRPCFRPTAISFTLDTVVLTVSRVPPSLPPTVFNIDWASFNKPVPRVNNSDKFNRLLAWNGCEGGCWTGAIAAGANCEVSAADYAFRLDRDHRIGTHQAAQLLTDPPSHTEAGRRRIRDIDRQHFSGIHSADANFGAVRQARQD